MKYPPKRRLSLLAIVLTLGVALLATGPGASSATDVSTSLGRPPLGSRVLRLGAVGLDVAILQLRLAWHGFPSGNSDGTFGPRTDHALRRYQTWFGMRPDGIFGRATYIALHAPPPVSPRLLSWPISGVVTSRFGPRGRRFHAGIDIAAAVGKPVHPAVPGRVVWAGWGDGGWGLLVVIAHASGLRTMYAHLSRIDVRLGQRVEAGNTLGLVGESGTARGPHLHFEVRLRGAAIDPLTGLSRDRRSAPSTSSATRTLVRRTLNAWSRHYGLDPCLTRALAWTESGYQPSAVSPAGATGVMQVTPETWAFVERSIIGTRVSLTINGNVRVGVAYLRYLLREFRGPARALAAYNQGPHALRTRGMLAHTRSFVESVLALRRRMRGGCASAR